MSGGNTLAKKFGTGRRKGGTGPKRMTGARGPGDLITFDKGTKKAGRPTDGIPRSRTARRYGQS